MRVMEPGTDGAFADAEDLRDVGLRYSLNVPHGDDGAMFGRQSHHRLGNFLLHLGEIGDIVDRITGTVDCVTARALAPLHQLIGFAEPLMRRGAKALFLKGQDVEAELTEATKYWKIEPRLHSSRTGGHGWIVELDRIERRTPSATALGSRA